VSTSGWKDVGLEEHEDDKDTDGDLRHSDYDDVASDGRTDGRTAVIQRALKLHHPDGCTSELRGAMGYDVEWFRGKDEQRTVYSGHVGIDRAYRAHTHTHTHTRTHSHAHIIFREIT